MNKKTITYKFYSIMQIKHISVSTSSALLCYLLSSSSGNRGLKNVHICIEFNKIL